MTELAIKATAVSKNFGNLRALDNVNFELRRGEVHCIVGENGCGKSTLIKVINGVYTPEPGASFVFGERSPIAAMSPSSAKARGIHVIWQDLSLFPDLTVGENIIFDEFVARPFATPRPKDALQRAKQTIKQLGVELDLDVPLGRLSIAKRQLVAICRVLQTKASIIFMDEPTASLTKTETENLLAIVRKLSDLGISIVFVSHRLVEVLAISSRVTVLRDGKLVGTFPTEGMTQRKLSKLMTGLDIEEEQRGAVEFGVPVLEVENLTVPGEFKDISFTLREGEIIGLTGLLGSGRTEIAHALFGMSKPSQGDILIDGQRVVFHSNRDAIRHGIAYVSEDRLHLGLHQTQSIIRNSAVTTLDQLANPGYYLNPNKVRQLCVDWIENLNTKVSDPKLPVNSLSGGNQQRIVLAKWLATKPRVLILDSPTVGVDVGAKAGIFRIVRALADQGMAILLISDESNEIHTHSDRILVLRDGRIVHHLSPQNVTEEDLVGIVNA
jgi:simple sugar transport system ATP-binding protein